MPKSFLATISSRKRHLLYGTAVGVLLAIGASEKVYAACPAFTAGDDDASCTGDLGGAQNALSGNDNVRIFGDASGTDLSGGANDDTITLANGSLDNLLGDVGNDTIIVRADGSLDANVNLGAGDDRLTFGGHAAGDIIGGAGNDFMRISNQSSLGDDVLGGDGNDVVSIFDDAVIDGEVALGNHNDTIVIAENASINSAGADVRLEAGDDQFTMTGGEIEDDIIGAVGNDQISMLGGEAEQILGGDDNDIISIGGSAELNSASENVVGGAGDDLISISGGNIENDVNASEGNDLVRITGGSVGEDVRGGANNDVMFVQNATIDGQFRGEDGDDILIIESGADIAGAIAGNDGEDQISMLGGVAFEIFGNSGNDIISMNGGELVQELQGGEGNDQLSLTGSGHVGFDVLGETGNDVIVIAVTEGSGVEDDVEGGAGNDIISMVSGRVGDNIEGNDGNDLISMTGGSVGDDIEGRDGNDIISMAGGFVADDVRGQSGNDLIVFSGGSIGDDIRGESGVDFISITGGSGVDDVFGGSSSDLIVIDGVADLGGSNIEGDDGDDVIVVREAASLSGANILGESGNDSMEAGAGAGDVLSGVTSLFGGTGTNDVMQFSGFDGLLSEEFGGFEQIYLLNGTNLDVHNPNSASPDDRDLTSFASGTPNFLFIDGTSSLDAGGNSPGDTTFTGNVGNLGVITMLDGTANDLFTITGDYAGNGTGTLAIDAELDITEIGDEFFLGNVADVTIPPPLGPLLVPEGTTAVAVNDVGDGIGQLTGDGPGDGIPVIDVSGGSTDDDDFFLLNGPIQAGAVEYDLVLQSDNIWYLQSDFLDQIFGYAAAPSAILGMARDYMGNLHERVGSLEQTWTGGATQISDGSGVWLRSGGFFGKVDSGNEDQRFDYDQNHWFVQVGADLALLSDASTGQLIGSIMGHAGYSNTKHDDKGNELITQNHIYGYGGGVALTWYGGPAGWAGEGLYVDGIAQVTFYDLETKTEAEGKRGETDGWGWSIGLEAGYGINIGGDRNGPRLVPQIQIVYSQINLDDFIDEEGVDVDFDNADSLEGRIGLAIDSGKMWRSVNAYAEANIVHEFLGDTDVTVTTLPVDYDLGGTSAEIGMGGTVSLLDNVFIYADVDYRLPFDDGRQGAQVIGGLRVAF